MHSALVDREVRLFNLELLPPQPSRKSGRKKERRKAMETRRAGMETVVVNIPTLNIFSVKKTTKNKLHIENILKALEDSRGALRYGPLRFKFFSDLQENQQKKTVGYTLNIFHFSCNKCPLRRLFIRI